MASIVRLATLYICKQNLKYYLNWSGIYCTELNSIVNIDLKFFFFTDFFCDHTYLARYPSFFSENLLFVSIEYHVESADQYASE